jgi:hypothetical protein
VKLTHFYHIFADGDYRKPVAEHFTALEESGLLSELDSVRLGIVGSKENREKVRALLPKYRVAAEAPSGWEQVTLNVLHRFSKRDSGAIFYAHTKGAFSQSELARQWRVSMTHDTVTRWRECVAALDTVDAAGPYWLKSWEPEHKDHKYFFAGNYWWACSDYIRRLDRVREDNRYQAEGWIGLADPSVRIMREGYPYWGNFRTEDETS